MLRVNDYKNMAEGSLCKECGCSCQTCLQTTGSYPTTDDKNANSDILHLHQEIELLKQQLVEREYYILQMETNVLKHAQQFPNGEWEHLQQELFIWKDKYERLYESHKKLQKVNQGLEDKLLKLVDKFETEKNCLNRDIADLTNRLVEARISITDLEEQNDQYRNDCNIALQLLQCKPSNFISQKLSSFPSDLQDKVRLHFAQQSQKELQGSRSSPELRTIRVPIPTFPPTAMVYSVNSVHSVSDSEMSNSDPTTPDYVSAAIMAKVLEERAKERVLKKEPCRVCCYRRHSLDYKDKATQTRMPLVNGACACNGGISVKVHTRHRSGSSSSTESYNQSECHSQLRFTNGGPQNGTETTI